MQNKKALIGFLERLGPLLAGIGAVIIVVQTIWVSYGVLMRYVFNRPDQYVTEATALMLVPCAFLGLAYAMQQDALPKVTMVAALFPPKVQSVLARLNQLIMLSVGGFFAYSAISAFIRANKSGAASEVLSWPRAWFWAPTALALVVFCIVMLVKLWGSRPGTSTQHVDKDH